MNGEFFNNLGNSFMIIVGIFGGIHQVIMIIRYKAPIASWLLAFLAATDCLCFAIAGYLQKDQKGMWGSILEFLLALGVGIFAYIWSRSHPIMP